VKLRKHSRFAVQLPAVYTAENIQSKGVVFNLSAEGCAIGSSKVMPKGAYLALQVSLSDQASAPHDLSAAVAQAGIVRTHDLVTWERLPDLVTRAEQQRNVVLHPRFVRNGTLQVTRE